MVERAGENCRISNVGEGKVRFIIDDCLKFVKREIRRGKKYDAIIMDPQSLVEDLMVKLGRLKTNFLVLLKLAQKF